MPTEDSRQKIKSLQQIVTHDGPVSIEDYMRYALSHQERGYYRSKEAIGPQGDFITAPEISQLFGEMIAIWFMNQIENSRFATSKNFTLIECGPGRGTLIRDILRTFQKISSFTPEINLHFLEINPYFKTALLPLKSHYEITFHDTMDSLLNLKTKGPFLILANEFLDVYPVRQFIFHNANWHEIKVSYDAYTSRFKPIIGENPCEMPPSLCMRDQYQEGDILEYSSEQEQIMTIFSELLRHDGGFGLWIDYGYTSSPKKSTLQAVRNHQKVDPFEEPGQSDLTTLIDFKRLEKKFENQEKLICTIKNQGDFLIEQGINIRASQLMHQTSNDLQKTIEAAVHRLTHSEHMGRLFKVLSVRSEGDSSS